MHAVGRLALPFLAVALLLGAACVGIPSERAPAPMLQTPVELHVLLPLSGDYAARGLRQWDVVALAVRRLNESRGPLDRPMRATIHDCGSTDEESEALAGHLVESGVQAFVGPHSSPSASGLRDFIDLPDTLVVLPDARDFPLPFGGRFTVTILPPDAIRGAALMNRALEYAADVGAVPAGVFLAKAHGEAASDVAAETLRQAMNRGLVPNTAEDSDLLILQASGPPPHDLVVQVAGASFVARTAGREWTDPGLPEETLWAESDEATAATYDAVVALGRVLRRTPEATARALREAVVDEPWEGMLGSTRFIRMMSGAWVGHPHRVEAL